MVLRELDLDANGTFDSQISTLFADGKRIEETRTLSGAGLVLSITRRVYGADDRLLSSAMDWTGDGIDDATTSYSYHPSLNVLTEIAMRNGDVLRSLEWWTYRADGQLVEHVERNEAGIRTFDEQKSYFANGWSASRTRKLVDIKFEETKIDVMACTYDYTTSCEPLASAPIPKLPTLGATQP